MGDFAETPAEMVRSFLRSMEARDLDAASQYLAPQVTITFPGGRAFTDLQQQVASSAQRFRRITKTFDGCDVVGTANGAVVYMFGTLAGEALDGTPFEGVRFIDRFVVQDGLIVDQRVWNDMAEVGLLPE